MKKHLLYLGCLILGVHLSAQTIHDIEAGGGPGGPTPYYSPQFITIELGDIVRWTNSGGTHNVDGTLAAYPDNPEGFTSGDPSNSLWVFEHTFTMPGEYGFECSAFDHADTQFGTITVLDNSTGFEELSQELLDVYPNPVAENLTISATEPFNSVRVFDMTMKEVIQVNVTGLITTKEISLNGLEQAEYLLEIVTDNETIYRRFIKE